MALPGPVRPLWLFFSLGRARGPPVRRGWSRSAAWPPVAPVQRTTHTSHSARLRAHASTSSKPPLIPEAPGDPLIPYPSCVLKPNMQHTPPHPHQHTHSRTPHTRTPRTRTREHGRRQTAGPACGVVVRRPGFCPFIKSQATYLSASALSVFTTSLPQRKGDTAVLWPLHNRRPRWEMLFGRYCALLLALFALFSAVQVPCVGSDQTAASGGEIDARCSTGAE